MRILGIDPGLVNVGWCLLEVDGRSVVGIGHLDARVQRNQREMVGAIVGKAIGLRLADGVDVVALEDFTWRAPKAVGHRTIVHGLDMCRLLGRLEERLEREGFEVVLVRPQDSKRNQPAGALAKRLRIPGRNDHERSAYYASLWLAGTLRLAGRGG